VSTIPHYDISALILDMDGVLWRDSEPIGNLPEIFDHIKEMGWKVILATNNATLSVPQYVDKLSGYGVDLQPEQIVNSAQAAAFYLRRQYPSGGGVFVIGELGLVSTLANSGFSSVALTPDTLSSNREPVLAVIVSLDRRLDYDKLTVATRLIRSGVPFIGSNPDLTFPTPAGLIPGAGAIIAAVEAATSVKPVVVGKPSPEMYKLAMERMGGSPENTLVIGDRLETDILGGQELGCRTALVLSGVTTQAAAETWRPAPTWIAPDLSSLLERIS